MTIICVVVLYFLGLQQMYKNYWTLLRLELRNCNFAGMRKYTLYLHLPHPLTPTSPLCLPFLGNKSLIFLETFPNPGSSPVCPLKIIFILKLKDL